MALLLQGQPVLLVNYSLLYGGVAGQLLLIARKWGHLLVLVSPCLCLLILVIRIWVETPDPDAV